MPDHNLNRLAGIVAEIVMTLGLDAGDCNLGPGPDICALGDKAAAALKTRLGGTPSGRAEELIADLEAEIVKRDARIAELEAERNRLLNNPKNVFKKMCDMALKQRDEFAAELAALKAQQPSSVADGYVMVPSNLNENMYAKCHLATRVVAQVWRDPLAAAPSAQQKESGDE